MLEFIIALLLSLGINVGDKSSMPKLDAETMNIVQADSRYEELGGDQAFQSIMNQENLYPKSEDEIVVTVDPNPIEVLGLQN